MPERSSIAWLQRCTTAAWLAAALAWLAAGWGSSPPAALAGCVLILLGHSLFLGAELLILARVSRHDTAPRARTTELLRAWVGETFAAARVFCWRQPFRWRAVPDHLPASARGRRGAVFIHGFMCNRGFWNPWLVRLRAADRPFVAVNLEPIAGPIESYEAIVEAAVRRVTEATGLPPVLVGHSMGGLAARAWLRRTDPGRVHHVVTLGTPHRGAWVAQWSRLPNGRQMRLQAPWLDRLAEEEAAAGPPPPLTCWYSNCDNVVFPVSSGTLAGADNRLVRAAGHVQLAFDDRVVRETIELITRL